VTIAIPRSAYSPETDFEGAFFSVLEDTQVSEADCMKYALFSIPKDKQRQVEINGVLYLGGLASSAAAGHQATDRVYRVFHGGVCFELQEGLRTSGYGSNDAISRRVDSDDVFRRLDAMMQSFRFIQ
jgi:hypothetical protein